MRTRGESAQQVPMKQQFIDTVLTMMDEGIPVRNINLRGAAKRIGCAHTNAYNYVSSREELLWWALKEALVRMIASAGIDPETGAFPAALPDLLEVTVDFALQHGPWYHLIWIEPLSGTPPDEVRSYLSLPSGLFEAWVRQTQGDDPHLTEKTRILHSFLHGELCMMSSGRSGDPPDSCREQILEHARSLQHHLFTPGGTI
ncbi:MAG: TetR/AcrR family transcriptional regulator [Spirochaetia bacterium]|nr:TetR/AcrR family transcriptional regulator [Spirochaetia bacterium]